MKIEITKEEKQLICNALNYVSIIKQKQVYDFYRINSEEERLELLNKSDAYYDLMCKIEEQKFPEEEINKHLTKIKDWDKLGNCSVRLYHILTGAHRRSWDKIYPEMLHIETITKKVFKRNRNAGQFSWTEFETLRGY